MCGRIIVNIQEFPLLNRSSDTFRKTALIVVIAVLSAAAGMAVWGLLQNPRPPAEQTLIELPEQWEIPAFSLTDQDGQPRRPGSITRGPHQRDVRRLDFSQ